MENNQQSNNININAEPLLTVSDISFRLHLSRSCSYALMQSGAIPTVRIGKSRRVRQEDLEAFIKHNIYSTFDYGE